MSLTAEQARRLRNWQVPATSHEYSRRDAALYALSVGFGDDPLDRRELKFVDHAREDFCVTPSMALILGYPGFWLGHQETGLDLGRILHVEQSIEILEPLAPAGRVIGHTRVTDLFDLGRGKGALLQSRRDISDADGRPIAIVRQSHMLAGYGGFGGEPPVKSTVEAPGQPACSVETRTLPQQALLYRLNGDLNPIHADPDRAERAGFARPILHGMCSLAMACRAVLRCLCAYEPQRLRSFSARMTALVFPGETLLHDIYPDGRFTTTVVERSKFALDRGSAVVLDSISQAPSRDLSA